MITQTITDFVFRSVAPRDIRHLERPDPKQMNGLSAEVIQQMALEFQTAPPITLHHPLSRLLAGVWAVSREAYVAGRAERGLREAVASEISKINQCPYCVDVHVAMLHGLGDDQTANAIADDNKNDMSETTRRTVEWAAANLSPEADILRHPPFASSEAPCIIGTALVFHYLNRMVHIFLPDSPLPVPSSLGWLKRSARTAFGRTVGSTISTRAAGNDAFPLAEEDAELPKEFNWARVDVRVAASFALFAKVAAEAGTAYLDPDVMVLVINHIEQWNGKAPGMGRRWVEKAVMELPENLRPAARLALLTALASYQVTDADIATFRKQNPSDEALLGVTGWASYQAMKRISSWLHPSEQT